MNIEVLKKLYRNTTGTSPVDISEIKQSGSNRRYYRLSDGDVSLIGCYNRNVKENESFFHLTEVFNRKELPVPQVFEIDDSREYYVQSDLGDDQLYNLVVTRKDEDLNVDLKRIYQKVLSRLIDFQAIGFEQIDLSKLYPIQVFNKESIGWDLEYFKYYFLKLHDIEFSDSALHRDFDTLIDHILNDSSNYFMYRDFQSRNIFLKDGAPYFIDYQGGRKGPLGYDVASLLYQAKARLTEHDREELLSYYIKSLQQKVDIEESCFLNYYYPIALLRVLQTLGAYGYRGVYQKKSHFLQSIFLALQNLKSLMPKLVALDFVPELKRCLQKLIEKEDQYKIEISSDFHVQINSFSYINGGVPSDFSGHGGGYAFDCRMLPNPGRLEPYKQLTGMDTDVINWLRQHPEVEEYIDNSLNLVKSHIEAYQKRGFKYLAINFGCTGGQHRSVYCADNVAKKIKSIFTDAKVSVNHVMQNKSYQI